MSAGPVKAALSQIMHNFPGVGIAFDTASHKAIDRWNIGLRLVESRAMADVPTP